MARYVCEITLSLILLAVAGGCATQRHQTVSLQARGNHTIFNPYWTGLPTIDVVRSPWPSTCYSAPAEEQIRYVETLVDIQGRSYGQDDYLRRRFTQVRTGRIPR